MNIDIRVAISFFHHRKTKRLAAKYGSDGVVSLLKLWAYAASFRSSGYLADMSYEDITTEADHRGDSSEFVRFLIDVKWIDETERGLYLHDWHIHNPWAAKHDERSDKGRFNRMGHTHPKLFKELQVQGYNAISKQEYDRLTKSKQPLSVGQLHSPAPAPAPAPAPEPNTTSPPAAPVSAAKVKKKSRDDSYVFPGIPEWIGKQEWDGYVEMRKKRSPLTDWGKHLTVLDLEKLRAAGYDPNAVLNQSTQKSWRGVFKIVGGNNGPHIGSTQGSGHPKADPGKYAELRPGERVVSSDEL